MTVAIGPGFGLAAWKFLMSGDPQPWFVTCGITIDGASQTGTGAANGCFNAWKDTLLQRQSNLLQLLSVEVTVGQDGAPTKAYSNEAATIGNEGGQMLPQNCALLVDKLTTLGGRRNRGRFYVPGILMEEKVSMTGQIDPTKVSLWQSDFNTFFTRLNEGTTAFPATPPVILHSTGQSVVPAPSPIASFRVQSLISTQRKRLR